MTIQRPNPPEVNKAKCVGCGLCLKVCPSFVLDVLDVKVAIVRGEWCIGCGHCIAICPMEALEYPGADGKALPQAGSGPAVMPDSLLLLFRERRSVRVYEKEPVPRDLINQVIEAGRYAPTGRNSQNVHTMVVTSAEEIERLRQMTLRFYEKIFARVRGRMGAFLFGLIAGRKIVESLRESLPKVEIAKKLMEQGRDPLFYHAPVVMLVHAESWDTCSPFNGGAALYNGSLMAHALGLECCFNWYLVNAVNRDGEIKRWLGIPNDHQCFGAMTLGYPDVKYARLVHREAPKVTWR